jgi:hypothetical protein
MGWVQYHQNSDCCFLVTTRAEKGPWCSPLAMQKEGAPALSHMYLYKWARTWVMQMKRGAISSLLFYILFTVCASWRVRILTCQNFDVSEFWRVRILNTRMSQSPPPALQKRGSILSFSCCLWQVLTAALQQDLILFASSEIIKKIK